MGSLNTRVTALMLLSLSITLSSTTAYTQTPKAPSPISLHNSAPKPSSSISLHNGAPPKAPKDEEARDLHYLRVHFISMINKTELMLGSVKPYIGRCTCAHACDEMYTETVDELENGLASVEARDWETLNVLMTGFSTYITTCDDCLELHSEYISQQAKECPDFGKIDAWMRGVAKDFLAIAVKYTNVPH